MFSVRDFRLKDANIEKVCCNRRSSHSTLLVTAALSDVLEHGVWSSTTGVQIQQMFWKLIDIL